MRDAHFSVCACHEGCEGRGWWVVVSECSASKRASILLRRVTLQWISHCHRHHSLTADCRCGLLTAPVAHLLPVATTLHPSRQSRVRVPPVSPLWPAGTPLSPPPPAI